ncbi:MAG: TonB-dependent receptor plug domain-containing protein, partial [Chromatiaceae bacterium]|nr:TonB-dependent receptor plug domain-containing protein [Chromatiaceae bacterium]
MDAPVLLGPILVIAPEEPPVGRSFSLGPSAIAPQRARTSDTAKLLTGLPGVSAYGAGGVSSLPVIRGLADERLRTTVDGMDLVASCPNHMNSPLSYIDPTAVASVEVFAGVTPVSVGGDSIGGTIVVESAPPAFAESGERLVAGEVGTFYRSNGDNWGGNLSATVASEQFSINYSGAYTKANNYQAGGNFKDYDFTGRGGHTLGRDEVGSSAYEASNQSLTLAWTDGATLLDLSYDHQDIPYEGFPNQRMEMTSNQSDQFNLGYASELAWGRLNTRLYYQQTRHEMDFGDDRRFWFGPGQPPLGSGGNTALNGIPCSPIAGHRMVNGMMVGCA